MRPRWPELPVELLIMAGVGAVTVAGTWTEVRWSPYPSHENVAVAYALAVVAAGALVARRRRPILVGALSLACLAAYHMLGYPGGAVAMPLFVAFYSIPAYGRTLWSFATCAVGVVLVVVILAVPPHRQPWWSFALLGPALGFAWMVILGAAARARRLAADGYLRRAELTMREGLAEERLRIARELHDVLAHTISVISVQAGVALDSLDVAPDQARAALLRVRAVAAEARPELRAALGLLRADGGTRQTLAQPGLDQLDDLVTQARAAGLRTTLRVAGDLPTLPPFVQLTLYRITQEALTNVVRHAHAAEVTITLDREPGNLRLQIRDDGTASPGKPYTDGLGIAGMRERAHLLGGVLQAGPATAGGFLLEAGIPVEAL